EVLLVSLVQLPCINLKSSFGCGYASAGRSGEIENQLEILVHEPERKLRAIVAVHRSLQFSHVRRSDDCSLRQHLEQTIVIEASLLTECNGLGNGLHSDSQQCVHDKLHGRSGAARPQIKILSGDGAKDRLGGGEGGLVSAPQQDQRPLLGDRSTPRYGHVEGVNSTLGTQSR